MPNLDIGLEIMYTKIETKQSEPGAGSRCSQLRRCGGRAAGLYSPSTEEVWSGIFRFQRNFWP